MSSPPPTPGIHHVTCIAGNPQENLDFWVETMGLRLVKRSINQDDPETYHFFFADAEGTPGTSMTFFPWEDMRQGKVGSGQVSRTAFRVPEGSLDYWEARFDEYGVPYEERVERFGNGAGTASENASGDAPRAETVLPFEDPDGLPVELVETEIPDDDPVVPWTEFVPAEHAIRGFHSVTLWVADTEPTMELLETMGLERVGSEQSPDDTPGDERTRFAAAGSVGKYVDVLPTIAGGRQGHGTVHHVAFQTPTDDHQSAMRDAVRSRGLSPTGQIDRHWFRSVYFREHGGVLFELATSDPGYDSDEPLSDLGGRLVLPGEFESRRDEIEAGLPDVTVPSSQPSDQ
ncbi:ring-cleaving dioxygenase [Salarchaeum sp. III]|uniref:ring-cleaving dioxygenase n=1 Tax=Salarchaeum sp. III TaxID=3107927 RepID=UPI002ED9FFE9